MKSCLFVLTVLGLYLYEANGLSASCQALGCPQCVGATGVCCGGIISPYNETYCNIYCLEEDQACCGCNALSNGKYNCFGCNTGDVCVHNTYNLTDGGLEYFCGGSSYLLPTAVASLFLAVLLLL